MLVPLGLPPGVYANGTALQAAGRWRRSSLVRWSEGAMQPVGGWRDRTGASGRPDAAPRGMFAWLDNSGNRRLAVGTHAKAFHISAGGTLTDITPASGFTAGISLAAPEIGYGMSTYGTAFYGVARPDDGTFSEATTWSFDNWGERLVACCTSDGKIMEWDLNLSNNLAALTGAPTGCVGLVVTEDRFLFALGAGGDKRKVQWCDREDNTTWTPSSTNEAGDFILQTQGQIMAGCRVRGQTLILTDRDAHVATPRADILIFGFEKVGTACGTVSRRAHAEVQGGAYWMGVNGFFRYNGGGVQEIPCEVSDYVFSDLAQAQRSQIHAVPNALFNEVWWFYPSGDSTTCDRYVAFNYQENTWAIGELERAAGVDFGVFPRPIWANAAGVVYEHEIGVNLGDETAYAESGPVEVQDGGTMFMATQMMPDERTQGEVTATFKARFWPNGAESEHGPYTMADKVDLRFTAREMRLRVDGAANKSWRWGVPRVKVEPRGTR